jgi:hypothetical protein
MVNNIGFDRLQDMGLYTIPNHLVFPGSSFTNPPESPSYGVHTFSLRPKGAITKKDGKLFVFDCRRDAQLYHKAKLGGRIYQIVEINLR